MLIAYFQNVQQINNYLLNRPVINFYTVSFSGSWGEACFSAGAGTPMMRRFNLQRGFPTWGYLHTAKMGFYSPGMCKVKKWRRVGGFWVSRRGSQAWIFKKVEPKRAKEGRENGTATRIRQILRKASKCLLSQIATLGQTAVWWRMEVRVASKIPKRWWID